MGSCAGFFFIQGRIRVFPDWVGEKLWCSWMAWRPEKGAAEVRCREQIDGFSLQWHTGMGRKWRRVTNTLTMVLRVAKYLCVMRAAWDWMSQRKLTLQTNFKFKSEIAFFCITLLCDWSRKLVPLSQPIKRKNVKPITTSTLAFSCALSVQSILLEFLLALKGIFLSSDWALWLLWVWFYFEFLLALKGIFLSSDWALWLLWVWFLFRTRFK